MPKLLVFFGKFRKLFGNVLLADRHILESVRQASKVVENLPKIVKLTNRMWFSVVCTLIDNDTRHHSSQNVVDSREAAE